MTTATPRSTIRLLPERGSDDRADLDALLDAQPLGHVAFVTDGEPRVIPTLIARDGDRVLLHGSPAAGFLRAARRGDRLALSVAILDGLVIARSAFHHSANYRSAVIHGVARRLRDEEQRAALDVFVDRLVPGRVGELRPNDAAELRQTEIVAMPLDDWSFKTRTGGPKDEPADLDADTWAGVVPLRMMAGTPITDAGSVRDRPTESVEALASRFGS